MKKLILLFASVAFIAANGVNADSYVYSQQKATATVQKGETKATMKVQGNCGMCKATIEKAAKSVEGVKNASWDQKTKELQVQYDSGKTSLDAISKAIAKAGYDTEKDKADDKAYNALHGCCKYRK